MPDTMERWSYWEEPELRPRGRWFSSDGHRHDPLAGLVTCEVCGSFEDVSLGGGAGDFPLCHDCAERGSPSMWELYYEQMMGAD